MSKPFIIQHQLADTAVNRFHYLVDYINTHPLKPADLLLVIDNKANNTDLFYGKNSKNILTVPIDSCFLEETKIVNHFHPTRYTHLKANTYFSVGDRKSDGGIFFNNNQFRFDIFNTLFFHISRYEEYYAPAQSYGSSGGLEENQHFLIKNSLYDNPVVDQLLVAFFKIITNKKIEKKSTYAISHDVDILTRFTPGYKFLRSLAATVAYRRGWPQFRDSITYYKKMIQQGTEDPYDYFPVLLRQEKKWTDKHIFMMSGGNTKYDNKYKITDPATKSIIKLAIDRGYSVGLHPSYNAGFDEIRFAEEQKKLAEVSQQSIIRNRQHCLRWSWKITPYLFEKNGIMTDSTMGYNRHLGFRCGSGFPYQMYDFKNKKAFSWTEHPMAFMESSAIHQARHTGENLSELMRAFLLKNRENTHLMLNFHNSNFDPLLDTGRQLRHFYEKELLDLCYG